MLTGLGECLGEAGQRPGRFSIATTNSVML